MVAFVPKLVLLCSSEAGRKQAALSAIRVWINKWLCAWVMRTGKHSLALVIRKYSVLPQMEMEKRCLLYKCDIYTFKKAEFIITSTGSASSKGQKNWVHYTQARYNLLFSSDFEKLGEQFWSSCFHIFYLVILDKNSFSPHILVRWREINFLFLRNILFICKVGSDFSFPVSPHCYLKLK